MKDSGSSVAEMLLKVTDRVEYVAPHLSHDEIWDAVFGYAQDKEIDFVVSDHYDTVYRHFEAVLAKGFRLLVLDDIADRRYTGNLLLNQNAFDANIYCGKIVRMDRLLLGPRFVLLRPEFASFEKPPEVRSTAGRILVTMGGADRKNQMFKILQALCRASEAWAIDVVLGPFYTHEESLKLPIANATHKISLHRRVASLLPLMKKADVMVCGAGSTVWEGCRMGIPMAVIQSAKNQDLIADQLIRTKAAAFLGDGDVVTEDHILKVCHRLMRDAGERQRLSTACYNLVDGGGAERVVREMERNFSSH